MVINGLFEIEFWDSFDLYNPDVSMGDYWKVFQFNEVSFDMFYLMCPDTWSLI